jgi:Ca2+-binding EF-hand superfamily protein
LDGRSAAQEVQLWSLRNHFFAECSLFLFHEDQYYVAGLRSAFEQFDKNKDGVLERGEFRRGLFLLKAGLSAAHISELMHVSFENRCF